MRAIFLTLFVAVVGCRGSASAPQARARIAAPSAEGGSGDAGDDAQVFAGDSGQSDTAGSAGAASALGGGGAGASQGGDGAVGGASAAGSGGAAVTDPDCAPSNTHALPAKCYPIQPVRCADPILSKSGLCVGSGECFDVPSYHCGVFIDDSTVCRDGRHASCPHGTCGTAFNSCTTYQNDVVYPTEFCPCAELGGIIKDP